MKNNFYIIMCAIYLFLLSSCNFFNPDNKEIIVQNPQYQNYESGFNYISRKSLKAEEVPEEARDFVLEKSEDYDVSYETVKATGSYEDMCSMGVNNDILYPGALVDTTNNAYKPITLKRAPLTLSTNLESILDKDAPISTTIDNPSLSTVRQGIREIVKNNINKTSDNLPANLSYTIREISNEEEFKLNIGFGLQVKKFDFSENFSYKNLNRQTNLVFVLKQVYYTIDMDTPTEKNSRDLFAKSLRNSEINDALKGTIPAYVSSVSYGRIAFIAIQTNYSKQEITNVLSASWGKMSDSPGASSTKKLSASLDTTLSHISSDSETTINCYVYGGNSGQTVTIGSSPETTIQRIFSTFNGGGDGALPISYTMRHLDGTLAKVQDSSEYTIKHVTYNPKKLMDWSFLDALIKNGTLFNNSEIILDFSAMIDYSNTQDAETNAKRTITIPDNVTDLTIIGPNKGAEDVIYNELSFKVDYRALNNPLTIHLDSMSFNADPNKGNGVCISSPYDALLVLDIKRRVNLTSYGGAPVIECGNLKIEGSGELVCNGSASVSSSIKTYAAINVTYDCEVDMEGSLTVRGSNGLFDAPTQILANGNAAIKCTNLFFKTSSISHLYGGDGSQPKTPDKVAGRKVTGSIGTSGGNGGPAIDASTITINSKNLHLHAGNGGQGGIGGQGSDGISEWDTGVDGGQGGQGGTGGQGGIPFVGALINDTSFVIYIYGGNGGQGGTGGTGGIGGISDGGGILIVDNSHHKGLNGGKGGNGGQGGNSSKDLLFDFVSPIFIIKNLDDLLPGNGGEGGQGGQKGYVYNHSWDHGTFYGIDGDNGSNGNRGEK